MYEYVQVIVTQLVWAVPVPPCASAPFPSLLLHLEPAPPHHAPVERRYCRVRGLRAREGHEVEAAVAPRARLDPYPRAHDLRRGTVLGLRLTT